MKTTKTFENATLRTVNNGFIELDCKNKVHCFHNASVVSIKDGVITVQIDWIPKNGELVRVEGDDCIPHYVIFTNQNNRILHGYGYVNTKFNPYSNVRLYSFVWQLGDKTKILPVSPEEATVFEEFCKTQGKIWNKEKLQWEEYKWQPKKGEKYWYIDTTGEAVWTTYNTMLLDPTRIAYGNFFPTKEKATLAAEQVKELFKSL